MVVSSREALSTIKIPAYAGAVSLVPDQGVGSVGSVEASVSVKVSHPHEIMETLHSMQEVVENGGGELWELLRQYPNPATGLWVCVRHLEGTDISSLTSSGESRDEDLEYKLYDFTLAFVWEEELVPFLCRSDCRGNLLTYAHDRRLGSEVGFQSKPLRARNELDEAGTDSKRETGFRKTFPSRQQLKIYRPPMVTPKLYIVLLAHENEPVACGSPSFARGPSGSIMNTQQVDMYKISSLRQAFRSTDGSHNGKAATSRVPICRLLIDIGMLPQKSSKFVYPDPEQIVPFGPQLDRATLLANLAVPTTLFFPPLQQYLADATSMVSRCLVRLTASAPAPAAAIEENLCSADIADNSNANNHLSRARQGLLLSSSSDEESAGSPHTDGESANPAVQTTTTEGDSGREIGSGLVSAAVCTADGPGLSGGLVGSWLRFTITPRDTAGRVCLNAIGEVSLRLTTDDGKKEEEEPRWKLDALPNGDIDVQLLHHLSGMRRLHVHVAGEPIVGSPFRICLAPQPLARSRCQITFANSDKSCRGYLSDTLLAQLSELLVIWDRLTQSGVEGSGLSDLDHPLFRRVCLNRGLYNETETTVATLKRVYAIEQNVNEFGVSLLDNYGNQVRSHPNLQFYLSDNAKVLDLTESNRGHLHGKFVVPLDEYVIARDHQAVPIVKIDALIDGNRLPNCPISVAVTNLEIIQSDFDKLLPLLETIILIGRHVPRVEASLAVEGEAPPSDQKQPKDDDHLPSEAALRDVWLLLQAMRNRTLRPTAAHRSGTQANRILTSRTAADASAETDRALFPRLADEIAKSRVQHIQTNAEIWRLETMQTFASLTFHENLEQGVEKMREIKTERLMKLLATLATSASQTLEDMVQLYYDIAQELRRLYRPGLASMFAAHLIKFLDDRQLSLADAKMRWREKTTEEREAILLQLEANLVTSFQAFLCSTSVCPAYETTLEDCMGLCDSLWETTRLRNGECQLDDCLLNVITADVSAIVEGHGALPTLQDLESRLKKCESAVLSEILKKGCDRGIPSVGTQTTLWSHGPAMNRLPGFDIVKRRLEYQGVSKPTLESGHFQDAVRRADTLRASRDELVFECVKALWNNCNAKETAQFYQLCRTFPRIRKVMLTLFFHFAGESIGGTNSIDVNYQDRHLVDLRNVYYHEKAERGYRVSLQGFRRLVGQMGLPPVFNSWHFGILVDKIFTKFSSRGSKETRWGYRSEGHMTLNMWPLLLAELSYLIILAELIVTQLITEDVDIEALFDQKEPNILRLRQTLPSRNAAFFQVLRQYLVPVYVLLLKNHPECRLKPKRNTKVKGT